MRNRYLLRGSVAALAAVTLAACTSSGGDSSTTGNTEPITAATGVASGAATKLCDLPKGFKVGIAIREIVNDVDRDIVKGATDTIKAAGGEVTVTDAGGDARKQNENVESLTNSGVNGLFAVLGDAQQLSPLTRKAADKGIKVATALFGATPDGALTDVGYDDPLASALMTRALFSSIGYKGDVYVFWVPGAPILETCKRVIEAIAKDYPQIKSPRGADRARRGQEPLADDRTSSPRTPEGQHRRGVGRLRPARLGRRTRPSAARVATRSRSPRSTATRSRSRCSTAKNSPFVATVVGDVNGIGRLGGRRHHQVHLRPRRRGPAVVVHRGVDRNTQQRYRRGREALGHRPVEERRLDKAAIESSTRRTSPSDHLAADPAGAVTSVSEPAAGSAPRPASAHCTRACSSSTRGTHESPTTTSRWRRGPRVPRRRPSASRGSRTG